MGKKKTTAEPGTGPQDPLRENPADIERRVIEIVKRQIDMYCAERGPVTRDTRFVEDLDADSLDAIELTMEAEVDFGISIFDERAKQVRTVGDAVDLVKEIMGR